MGSIRVALYAEACQLANQAEIEIGLYQRGCIGKERIGSIDRIKRADKRPWNRRMNAKGVKINWQFTSITGSS